MDLEVKKGHKALWIITAVVSSLSIGVIIWWFTVGRWSVSTDDAYVGGNRVVVRPEINGAIAKIYKEETDMVEAGDLLFLFDVRDFAIDVERKKADLALAIRSISAKHSTVLQLQQEVNKLRATLLRAENNFNNRKSLIETGAVSEEDFVDSLSTLKEVESTLEALLFQKEALEKEILGVEIKNHPQVLLAKEALRESLTNLARTEVRAPVSGILAMREVQVGESVTRGYPLISVIPIDEMWVNANFKEDQLREIEIGQDVEVYSDYYGDSLVYKGKVTGIGGGTGSVFSVLPPQNASGNWIKIVQRLPVRVDLDPEQMQSHPLRLGLSMYTKVDLRKKTGGVLSSKKEEKARYKTAIFKTVEIEPLFEKILKENSFYGD